MQVMKVLTKHCWKEQMVQKKMCAIKKIIDIWVMNYLRSPYVFG